MRSLVTLVTLMLAGPSHAGGSECVYYPDYFHWQGVAPRTAQYLLAPVYRGDYVIFSRDGRIPGSEDELVVFDVRNPAEPRLMLESGPIPDDTTRVVSSADLHFLSGNGPSRRVRLVDVSDPLNPACVGFIEEQAQLTPFAMQDSLLFGAVNSSPTSFQIWNIADPRAPVLVAIAATSQTLGMFPHGNFLYLRLFPGIKIWDISNPSNPVPRGLVNGSSVLDVEVSGVVMYITKADSAVRPVDISDPDHPVPMPRTGPVASTLDIIGSRVFFATGNSVGVANLTGPFTMSVEREWPRGGQDAVVDVRAADDWLLLSTWRGVVTMDWTRAPTDVVSTLGEVDLLNVRDIALAGRYAYVAGPGGYILDVADPAHPAIVGEVQLPAPFFGVDIDAGRLYYALDTQGLYIGRLENPLSPIRESVTLFGSRLRSVEVEEDLAVVGTDASELMIVDVSLPAAPVLRSTLTLPFVPGRIDVVGRFAYVPGGGGVTVIDITNLDAPLIRGFAATPGSALAVELAGPYAYVADGDMGLTILNVSDPDLPTLLANRQLEGPAADVDVVGSTIHVATHSPMLTVVDAENPAEPQVMGAVYGGFETQRMLAHQGIVIHGCFRGIKTTPGQCQATALDFAGLRADIVGRAVRILWAAPLSGRSAYRIFRSESRTGELTEVTRESVEGTGELQFLDDSVLPNMTYWYCVGARSGAMSDPIVARTPAWSEELAALEVVGANPSRVAFDLRFSIPARGSVRLAIYDVAGRLVRVIREGSFAAGAHDAAWDARDPAGHRAAAGTYFAALAFAERTVRHKLVLTP